MNLNLRECCFGSWWLGYMLLSISVGAQVANDSELFIDLKAADSILFEEGFNNCNIEALDSIIHADLEFLHDQSGIQDREAFFEAVKQNICSNPDIKPIRKLIDNTLQVYPLYNNGKRYGAVQQGIHKFYLAEPGKELRLTSRARFIHTWMLVNGRWQLYNVISFDHGSE